MECIRAWASWDCWIREEPLRCIVACAVPIGHWGLTESLILRGSCDIARYRSYPSGWATNTATHIDDGRCSSRTSSVPINLVLHEFIGADYRWLLMLQTIPKLLCWWLLQNLICVDHLLGVLECMATNCTGTLWSIICISCRSWMSHHLSSWIHSITENIFICNVAIWWSLCGCLSILIQLA